MEEFISIGEKHEMIIFRNSNIWNSCIDYDKRVRWLESRVERVHLRRFNLNLN